MELFSFRNIRPYINKNISNLIDIKDKLGYESSSDFFKSNKNTIFNNCKLIPKNENVITIGKTKDKNNFVLSFKEMRGHIFLIDERKKLLNKMIEEIITKRSGLFIIEDEKTIKENIQYCIENNKDYNYYENNICFSITLNENFNKDILKKLIILIMGDKNSNHKNEDVYNYIVEKKGGEVFFSQELINEIINYVSSKYEKNEKLLESLEKIKNVFSSEYTKENDILEKMLDYKNVFIYSKCSFINKLSVILIQNNIYIDFLKTRKLEDYCIVIPNINKNEFEIEPVYFAQCRSMGNKMIIYSNLLEENNNCYNLNTNITIQELKNRKEPEYIVSHEMGNDIIRLN